MLFSKLGVKPENDYFIVIKIIHWMRDWIENFNSAFLFVDKASQSRSFVGELEAAMNWFQKFEHQVYWKSVDEIFYEKYWKGLLLQI